MGIEIGAIQYLAKNNVSRARSIARIVETVDLENLNQSDLVKIKIYISRGDLESLRSLLKFLNRTDELGEMSSRELRTMAADLRIKNYSRLSKEELLSAIHARRT